MNLDYLHKLKKAGCRIGITFSQFDLLHAGHILMLSEAKKYCNYLICGIQNNANIERKEKNIPIQSVVERQIILSGIKFVDEIIVYNFERDIEDILLTFPIDVRIIGEEYKDKEFTGKQICISNGIDVVYNSRKHNFSSSRLRNKLMG
jgi:glycerol-3-phosphate cytidylyltransferase